MRPVSSPSFPFSLSKIPQLVRPFVSPSPIAVRAYIIDPSIRQSLPPSIRSGPSSHPVRASIIGPSIRQSIPPSRSVYPSGSPIIGPSILSVYSTIGPSIHQLSVSPSCHSARTFVSPSHLWSVHPSIPIVRPFDRIVLATTRSLVLRAPLKFQSNIQNYEKNKLIFFSSNLS